MKYVIGFFIIFFSFLIFFTYQVDRIIKKERKEKQEMVNKIYSLKNKD